MSRSGLEGLLVPLIDLLMLVQRTIKLRIALAKAELRVRVSSLAIAAVLCLFALVLAVITLVLLVQAGLLGLALLGLTPIQALLATAGLCVVLALILLLVARASLRRATLPLSSLTGNGENLPAKHP